MFQPSEDGEQRSRIQTQTLPKIGSANPEVGTRFKRASAYENSRGRDGVSPTGAMRERQLSTAQPQLGFKGSAQSHAQRSRTNAAPMNDTGFDWKQVDLKMKSNSGFDSTQRTASVHVPAAYRPKKEKIGPAQLLDMMDRVGHKGPI